MVLHGLLALFSPSLPGVSMSTLMLLDVSSTGSSLVSLVDEASALFAPGSSCGAVDDGALQLGGCG